MFDPIERLVLFFAVSVENVDKGSAEEGCGNIVQLKKGVPERCVPVEKNSPIW